MAYFGHLNLDVTISVENIAVKGSAAATGLRRQYGGTLGNFSMVASSLGLDFHPYAAVSGTTHAEYLAFMKTRGIDVSTITVESSIEGPVCYIISDGKEQNAYMFQGPMERWKPENSFNGEGYKYIHFSTGPPESYLKISERKEAKRVFDPSQELFYKYSEMQVRKFLDSCDIVMGNRQEIEAMLKIAGVRFEDPDKNFSIIMTDGDRGTLAFFEGNTYAIRTPKPERIVDTIGAGDAFRAGFYASLYRGMEMIDAIAAGNITASVAISRPMADFAATWEDIKTIYDAKATELMS